VTRVLVAAALRPRLTLVLVLAVSIAALFECRHLRIDNSKERVTAARLGPASSRRGGRWETVRVAGAAIGPRIGQQGFGNGQDPR